MLLPEWVGILMILHAVAHHHFRVDDPTLSEKTAKDTLPLGRRWSNVSVELVSASGDVCAFAQTEYGV